MISIDLNCDMGEGIGNEEALMPFISSANIACGYHAGDETEIRRVILLCKKHDVAAGAHPSFADKENFGRTEMQLPADEVYQLVKEQIEIINKIAINEEVKLHHVKPHGALYNMAAKDAVLANAVAAAVKDIDARLIFYGLSGSLMITEANKLGLKTANEVFADRTYQPDATLTPRSKANALITNETEAIRHVLQMVELKKVTAVNGEQVSIKADTICLHGDGEHAVTFAKALHKTLNEKGITIKRTNR